MATRHGDLVRERGCVLVVDDDEHILILARALFTQGELEVITAGDGLEGLERARARRPDVIVTDIQMPRMGGIEFFRAARRDPQLASIPFLFITSYPESLRAVASMLRSDDLALRKPFDLEELARETLRRSRSGGTEADGS